MQVQPSLLVICTLEECRYFKQPTTEKGKVSPYALHQAPDGKSFSRGVVGKSWVSFARTDEFCPGAVRVQLAHSHRYRLHRIYSLVVVAVWATGTDDDMVQGIAMLGTVFLQELISQASLK